MTECLGAARKTYGRYARLLRLLVKAGTVVVAVLAACAVVAAGFIPAGEPARWVSAACAGVAFGIALLLAVVPINNKARSYEYSETLLRVYLSGYVSDPKAQKRLLSVVSHRAAEERDLCGLFPPPLMGQRAEEPAAPVPEATVASLSDMV